MIHTENLEMNISIGIFLPRDLFRADRDASDAHDC
jgi:hypothetical protein